MIRFERYDDENRIFLMYVKKYAVYYFQISFFVPAIFKFLKMCKLAMETEFSTAVGVLPVKLLAYQVSMVCAANWLR